MCYLQLSRHYLMRHYSQNAQICVVPDIHLSLHRWTHRVSITFLQMIMRMRMMGVQIFIWHHLGDICLTRHLRLLPDLKDLQRAHLLQIRLHYQIPTLLAASDQIFEPHHHSVGHRIWHHNIGHWITLAEAGSEHGLHHLLVPLDLLFFSLFLR